MSFVVSIIISCNDDISLFPIHKIKRGRLLILFRLELVRFTPLVLTNKQIDRLQISLYLIYDLLNCKTWWLLDNRKVSPIICYVQYKVLYIFITL